MADAEMNFTPHDVPAGDLDQQENLSILYKLT
jgi:hypothetical protein